MNYQCTYYPHTEHGNEAFNRVRYRFGFDMADLGFCLLDGVINRVQRIADLPNADTPAQRVQLWQDELNDLRPSYDQLQQAMQIMQGDTPDIPDGEDTPTPQALRQAATFASALKSTLNAPEVVAAITDDQALDLPPTLFTPWEPGLHCYPGRIVAADGILYRVQPNADHVAQADWPPKDTPALFAVIQLHDPDTVPLWLFGEVVEIGMRRRDPDDGQTYRVYANPGQSFHPPHQAPATWEVVADD